MRESGHESRHVDGYSVCLRIAISRWKYVFSLTIPQTCT